MTSKTNESAKHPLYLAGLRDGRAAGIAECLAMVMGQRDTMYREADELHLDLKFDEAFSRRNYADIFNGVAIVLDRLANPSGAKGERDE